MSPDVPTVKVRALTFNWSKWILVIDILNMLKQILLTFLTSIALSYKFCEKFQVVVHGFSLVCAIT